MIATPITSDNSINEKPAWPRWRLAFGVWRSAFSADTFIRSMGLLAPVNLAEFAVLAQLILVNDIGLEHVRLRSRQRIGVLMASSNYGRIDRSLWCGSDGDTGCAGCRVDGPSAASGNVSKRPTLGVSGFNPGIRIG